MQQSPAAVLQSGSDTHHSGSAAPPQTAAANATPICAQNLQPLFEEDEDEGPED